MALDYVETALDGLDLAIVAAAVVVVVESPRCSAVAFSAAAATRISGLPPYGPYGGGVHGLPPPTVYVTCDTPPAHPPSHNDSMGAQQQGLEDDDQTLVLASASHSRPTHTNNDVVVVTPAHVGANPSTSVNSLGERTIVPPLPFPQGFPTPS